MKLSNAKQQKVQDDVPNLNKLTTEQLEGLARKALHAYGELNNQSKQIAAEKKAAKERAIPVLRAYRSRLSRRGNGEWQAWFEENKKDFGGVSVRSVNRWLGDKDENPKFANLDVADGVRLGGRKYSVLIQPNDNGTLTINCTPYVKPEVAAEVAVETQAEPAKPVDEKKEVVKLYKAARKRLNNAIREFEPFSQEQVAANENDSEPWIDVTVGGAMTSYTGEKFQTEYDRLNKEFEDAMAAFKPIQERALALGLLEERKPKVRNAAADVPSREKLIAEGVRIIDKLNGQFTRTIWREESKIPESRIAEHWQSFNDFAQEVVKAAFAAEVPCEKPSVTLVLTSNEANKEAGQ